MESLIECNPDVMGGRPVFRNTRIPIEVVFRELAAGTTLDEVFEDFPNLTQEHIRAAFDFALEAIREVSGRK